MSDSADYLKSLNSFTRKQLLIDCRELVQQRDWAWAQVEKLRDEVTDRANVEADLRAQLAETKAVVPLLVDLPDGPPIEWGTESVDQIEQAVEDEQ